MRNLRTHLINIYSIVGLAAVFVLLLGLTGHLLGILTPQAVTTLIAAIATSISQSAVSFWMIAIVGWLLATWSASYLMKTRQHPPIPITEDEIGAVEITTDALCSLAKTEARNQGVTGPMRADFTRKYGAPSLQVWCDLTSVEESEGPVAMGEKLKQVIESRFRQDFNLEGIKVSVIHQPVTSRFRRPKPQAG